MYINKNIFVCLCVARVMQIDFILRNLKRTVFEQNST